MNSKILVSKSDEFLDNSLMIKRKGTFESMYMKVLSNTSALLFPGTTGG